MPFGMYSSPLNRGTLESNHSSSRPPARPADLPRLEHTSLLWRGTSRGPWRFQLRVQAEHGSLGAEAGARSGGQLPYCCPGGSPPLMGEWPVAPRASTSQGSWGCVVTGTSLRQTHTGAQQKKYSRPRTEVDFLCCRPLLCYHQ